jgi:hypothetical protein
MIRMTGLIVMGLLIGAAPLGAQTAPAPTSEPGRIVFRFEHSADLRGLINVLQAFRSACLQPLTRDLPARLVPEGYQVVTRDVHWWGKDEGQFPDTAILSRTGREDDDLAGGYPIIDLMLPNDKIPNGACSVHWKRAFAPGAGQRLSLDLAASLAAHVSFHLGAVLVSRPDDVFAPADRYPSLTTWKTPCRNAACLFQVNAVFDTQGIDITISHDGGR